jgi:hypothetical protein
MGVGGQRNAPAAFLKERKGMYFAGGWVNPGADLNGCEPSRPHWDSIPGPSSP